ncbi:4Fe-4S dicluster domain-containing protein [Candidatus Bathyarchaeota archaeon]|nr:MAG: 4Fe-4S dicluster domain-containing protein [Candidatus Bathyarchaeota archaeon]
MVRVLLRFSREKAGQPITSQVILETGVPINILGAYIDQQGGEILVEVPSDRAEEVIRAFRERGVTVDVRKLIEVDKGRCLDCGACISLCPVGAIAFTKNLSVVFDREKCLGSTCGLCVDACPVKAIRLIG